MTDTNLTYEELQSKVTEQAAELVSLRAKSTLDDAAIDQLKARITAAEGQEAAAWELRSGKTDRVLLEITNDAGRAHNWKCSLMETVPLYLTPIPPSNVQPLTDYKALYEDLLYSVAKKYPGESRHDTAKRYLIDREKFGVGDGIGASTKEQKHD